MAFNRYATVGGLSVFGSTILDVAAGIVFGFLAISLFTSAAVEAINSLFNVRANSLKTGIMELVNDPKFTGLAKQLYEHALEFVRKHHVGLHSFRSMRRMEARRRKASALRLRHSQSLASLRQRPSQARVRSTIQRLGRTTKPLA